MEMIIDGIPNTHIHLQIPILPVSVLTCIFYFIFLIMKIPIQIHSSSKTPISGVHLIRHIRLEIGDHVVQRFENDGPTDRSTKWYNVHAIGTGQ
jgi:hypothetical protein